MVPHLKSPELFIDAYDISDQIRLCLFLFILGINVFFTFPLLFVYLTMNLSGVVNLIFLFLFVKQLESVCFRIDYTISTSDGSLPQVQFE